MAEEINCNNGSKDRHGWVYNLTPIADLRSMSADLQKKPNNREKEISDLRGFNNRHNK